MHRRIHVAAHDTWVVRSKVAFLYPGNTFGQEDKDVQVDKGLPGQDQPVHFQFESNSFERRKGLVCRENRNLGKSHGLCPADHSSPSAKRHSVPEAVEAREATLGVGAEAVDLVFPRLFVRIHRHLHGRRPRWASSLAELFQLWRSEKLVDILLLTHHQRNHPPTTPGVGQTFSWPLEKPRLICQSGFVLQHFLASLKNSEGKYPVNNFEILRIGDPSQFRSVQRLVSHFKNE